MYNPGDDNELDELSREAADRYEVPGNPSWDKLERELDKVLPVEKRKRKRFFFYWWLLPAIVAGGMISYWLMNSDRETAIVKTNIPNGVAANATREKEIKENAASYGTIESEKADKNIIRDDLSSTANQTKLADRKKVTAKTKEKNNAQIGNTTTVVNNTSVDNASTNKANNQAVAAAATTVRPAATDTSLAVKNPVTAQQTTATDTGSQIAAPLTTAQKPPYPTQKKWSIAAVVGADMSTVKFKYANNVGYNVGAIIGFHLNNQWSIHTGGIYTQKNYRLAGPDFTAPKGTNVANYKLDLVEGYCRMWEVPLYARYSFTGTSANHFFVSAGVSSYFMTKENYTYYYPYNGQPVQRTTSYNSTDTHILSIVHLSAGIEKRISKNLSAIIEPYAKIPMTGIGWGSVKLSSFGLNFAVQYRQARSK